MMVTDAELLRRYVSEESEEAFRELVNRHLPLVYSAALRHLGGDAHLARDVAQLVFTALARKASALVSHASITGWLYLGTHHAAAQAVRANRRRARREQESHDMHTRLGPETSTADWDRVRPVLDTAMRDLSAADREAVLLRYFEQRPFSEIGAALQLSEDAARMRVERALDKLHALLARRGVTSTTTALALTLQGNLIAAPPPGLAATVAGYALGATYATHVAAAGGFLATLGSGLGPALALSAAAIAIGAAFYSVRRERRAEYAVSVSLAQNARATARHDTLAGRLADAERLANAGRMPSAAASTPVANAAANDGTDEKAIRAGDEFLTANPEARRLIDDIMRGVFDRNYLTAMQAIGLTAAEAERIAGEAAKATGAYIDVGLTNMKFRVGNPGPQATQAMEQRLRELLGDDRYREVEERRLALAAHAIMKTIASTSFDTDAALVPGQADALAQLIDRHRHVSSQDGAAISYGLDWKAIAADAANVLSPAQMVVFNAAMAKDAMTTQALKLPPR
jgi:RNA polymerase sigma factor (sigma-70 family)